MVTIELYNYTGTPNVVSKTLGAHTDVTGVLYDNTNVITPVIKIERPQITFNYVRIVELNRYYFVRATSVVDSNFWRIELACDTLQTFAQAIKQAVATSVKTDLANYDSNNTPVYDVRRNLEQTYYNTSLDETGTIIMVTIKGN